MNRNIINIKSLFALIICLLAIFDSSSAFAQSFNLPDVFTPPDSDVSMSVLKSLFGALPMFGGAGTDAFQQPIALFNQLVLFVGGILAAYGILNSIAMTPHDGALGGKNVHSVWFPIRTALGAALVLPIFNGYCIMQYLVMWCVVQGIGLADSVWSSFVSSSNMQNIVAVSYNSPELSKFAHDVIKAEMCMAAVNTFYNTPASQGGNPNLLPEGGIQMAVTPVTTTDSAPADLFSGAPASSITTTVYKFGNALGTGGIPVDFCGTVTLTPMTIASATANTSSTSQSLAWTLGVTGPYTQNNINAINAAQQQAVTQFISDAQTLTQNAATTIKNNSMNGNGITSSDIQSFNQSVDAMIGRYNQTVHSAAAQAMNSAVSFQDISNEASKDGWALAGAWFMKFVFLQDRTQQAIANVPTSSSIDSIPSNMMGDLGNIYMQGLSHLASTSNVSGDYGINDDANNQSFVKDGDMGAAVTRLVGKALNFTINDEDNPVMTVKRMGDWMITVAGVLSIAKIASTAGLAGKALSLVGISKLVTVVLSPVIVFLVTLGFISAWIIPMTPFIMWFGILGAFVLLVVEAVIAAPLWAVMLCNPHANNLLGEQRRGLQMVLNLTLRPVLAIFGLAASIILIQVLGTLLNHIFSAVWVMSQSSSNILVAILGMAAGVLVYDVMTFLLIKKLFGAIHQIPDQLLNWIGGNPVGFEKASSNLTAGMMQLNNHIGSAANNLRNIAAGAATGGALGAAQGALTNAQKGNTSQSKNGPSNSSSSGESGGALSSMEENANNNKTSEVLTGLESHSPELAESFSESGIMSNINNSQDRKDTAVGFDNMVSQAYNALGGSHSEAGQNYSASLSNSLRENPYMNKGQMAHASNTALVGAMDNAYGTGASQITSTIATKADGSISRSSALSTAETYKGFVGAMNSSGMDNSAKLNTLSSVNAKAIESHTNDSSTPMATHLSNSITQHVSGLSGNVASPDDDK